MAKSKRSGGTTIKGGKGKFKVGAKTRTPRVGARAKAAVKGQLTERAGRGMKGGAINPHLGIPREARESAEMSAAAGSSNEGK